MRDIDDVFIGQGFCHRGHGASVIGAVAGLGIGELLESVIIMLIGQALDFVPALESEVVPEI